MRWMNGLTAHCTEDILALLGIGRGLCLFPFVLHVDIQIHHLAELKLFKKVKFTFSGFQDVYLPIAT